MQSLSYPRESVRWPATWEDAAGATHEGEVCDVSAGGAFVRVPPGLAVQVGSRVRLRLAMPGWASALELTATVRWRGESPAHRCHGIGLELDRPSGELGEWVGRPTDAAYAAHVACARSAGRLVSDAGADGAQGSV